MYTLPKSGQVNFYGVKMTSEHLLNLFHNVRYSFIPPPKFYTSQKQISGYAPVYNPRGDFFGRRINFATPADGNNIHRDTLVHVHLTVIRNWIRSVAQGRPASADDYVTVIALCPYPAPCRCSPDN